MSTKVEARPQPEVDAERKRLEELLDLVPARDAFGGDNQAKIQAAIDVIDDFMDEDEIYDMQDSGEWDDDETSHAQEMLAWLNCERDESPSSGWEDLV